MRSRYARASWRRCASSSHRRWRWCLRRLLRTSPAAASACRCLVTAWRVTGLPALSRTMESGPSSHSLATSLRRVSSPSAAKIGAAPASRAALGQRDMALDVADLFRPAALVHPEGLVPARGRDPVEARLRNGQPGAASLRRRQPELDERRGLRGVVDVEIDRVGVPAEREQALPLHALDQDLHPHVLVSGICDATPHRLPLGKRLVELHAEPGAELL